MARIPVHDLSGRRVAVPVDAARPAGTTEIRWPGRRAGGGRLASGVCSVLARAEDAGTIPVLRSRALPVR